METKTEMGSAGVEKQAREDLGKALSLHAAGRWEAAATICRQVLESHPNDAQAMQLLALCQAARGELEDAADLLERAVDLAPGSPQMRHNLGSLRQRQGRDDEALAEYRRAAAMAEDYAAPHFAAAALLQRRGANEAAVASYRSGLKADPANVGARINLSLALRALGNFHDAEAILEAGLRHDPANAGILLQVGDLATARADWPKAIGAFRQCLSREAGSIPAYMALAGALRGSGDLAGAIETTRQAVGLDPGRVASHRALALLLDEAGDPGAALAILEDALGIVPDNAALLRSLAAAATRVGDPRRLTAAYARLLALSDADAADWGAFADAVRLVRYDAFDPTLGRLFAEALGRPDLDHQNLAIPAVSLVGAMPGSDCLEAFCAHERAGTTPGRAELEQARAFFEQPLVARLLRKTIIPDSRFEFALTALRRGLLREMSLDPAKMPLPGRVVLALADHCLLNEYVYLETDEEGEAIDSLTKALSTPGGHLATCLDFWSLLACYRRLADLSPLTTMLRDLAAQTQGPLAALIERHYREPMMERSLQARIETLTPISNQTSQAVRLQYEENPYPRWRTLKRLPPQPFREVVAGILSEIAAGELPSPSSPRILVAGCGTGRHALMTASLFAASEVLAIDLSGASLAFAERRRAEAGITNVRFAQADILQLDSSIGDFDLIECSGVLHHLADPILGWRVLLERLAPGGLMKVALYSDSARQHIVEARKLIAERDYKATPHDIRRCRREILGRPGDPVMAKIAAGADFFSLSPCRDLIFHVQEKRFTIPELGEAIRDLGLSFLGFELRDPAVERMFRRAYPDRRDGLSLGCWAAFEAAHPDTFAEMYNFWVRPASTG